MSYLVWNFQSVRYKVREIIQSFQYLHKRAAVQWPIYIMNAVQRPLIFDYNFHEVVGLVDSDASGRVWASKRHKRR